MRQSLNLDSIEKAIRSAFEKGDPSDRAFREKVYRSAFGALDRALQANPNVTQDIVARRRQALSQTISAIESEFIPAVPAVDTPATARASQSTPAPVTQEQRSEPGFAPTLAGEDRNYASAADDDYDDGIDPPSYEGYGRPQRRSRSWLAIVVTLAILAVVGAGAWWMFAPSGPESFPRPPQDAEDFTPEQPAPGQPPRIVGGGDTLDDWIAVFDPADPTTVTAPGDSRAEITEDDGERFIRIRSGASGSPILFDVGQGVLEEVAGKRTVFNIVARAQEGEETQISVDCSLGELGDCGRKRYAVGSTREEFLFEMELPATNPGAGGTIAINPDIEGGGKSLDVYAIRVTPAE